MKHLFTNQSSITMFAKQFFKDYAWLLLLLAPLAMMPFMIVDKPEKVKKHLVKAVSQSVVMFESSEVTSAQVASIVSKPITALIKMDVYISRKQTTASTYQQYEEANLPTLLLGHHGNNEALQNEFFNHASVVDGNLKGQS